MRRITLNSRDTLDADELRFIAEVLHRGELIIAPTETSYMLGGNALDVRAIEKVYRAKVRHRGKPLPVVVSSLDKAKECVVFNSRALLLAERFWPGPLTMVLPARKIVPSRLTGVRGTLGIRVSSSALLRQIAAKCDCPLIATSANRSGDSDLYQLPTASKRCEGGVLRRVSVLIDGGKLPPKPPSTIIDLSADSPQLLRSGPVSKRELKNILHTPL